jgi:hypothetical protein
LSERKASYGRYKDTAYITGTDPSSTAFQQFITDYEGLEIDDDDTHEQSNHQQDSQQFVMTSENNQFFTEFGTVNPNELITALYDNTVYHALTAHLPDNSKAEDESESFVSSRYDNQIFYGILIDTGAAGVSTAGIQQVRSLQRRMPSISIDESTKGHHHIAFRAGDATSMGTITVPTPIGDIRFQVVLSMISFLLCLTDMDRLNVAFDNIANVLY